MGVPVDLHPHQRLKVSYVDYACSIKTPTSADPGGLMTAHNPWKAQASFNFNLRYDGTCLSQYLSSRPAEFTEQVPGQPELHREALSQSCHPPKNKPKEDQTKNKFYFGSAFYLYIIHF